MGDLAGMGEEGSEGARCWGAEVTGRPVRCPPASLSSLGVLTCVGWGDGDGGMEYPLGGSAAPSLSTHRAVPKVLSLSESSGCWALGTRVSPAWRSIPEHGPILFPGLLPSTWDFSTREKKLVPTWSHRSGLGEPAGTNVSEAGLVVGQEGGWVTPGVRGWGPGVLWHPSPELAWPLSPAPALPPGPCCCPSEHLGGRSGSARGDGDLWARSGVGVPSDTCWSWRQGTDHLCVPPWLHRAGRG